MTLVRQSRNYFIGNALPRGTSYKRFKALNRPDENAFRNMFNSVLMPTESDDTAQESIAGHVKLATDANVINRTSSFGDAHSRVVKPSQIPIGAYSIENENLTYKLINDENNPGANKYYGTNAYGDKGYHPIAGSSVYLIDVPTGACVPRVYTDGNVKTEKKLIVPHKLFTLGSRIIWTMYYCSSSYDSQTRVQMNLGYEANGGSILSRTTFWKSNDDCNPPIGTNVDAYVTTCKTVVVIDILAGGIIANAYNEYHKHGDDEYISGRSCCYLGGYELFVDDADMLLSIDYIIPNSNNQFIYGRSEVEIFQATQMLSTV